ncbi:MAG: amine dehydrogenase large subunit [Pseudomonadota bacterium]
MARDNASTARGSRALLGTRFVLALVCAFMATRMFGAEWDSVVGSVVEADTPDDHWVAVRGRYTSYLVDGDEGTVEGTLTLSMFTPAIRPHLSAGKYYAYGSYYSRTFYGERTDLVTTYDAKTLAPIGEIEIPPKSAGIGHDGMIGLIDDRFVGVWNITPGMSVSIVDVTTEQFVGELSTPGCAAVYPMTGGFLMPCGDGTLQFIGLDEAGKETKRLRSDAFFNVEEDPVFDYAVPTAGGWLFMSFNGQVFEATMDGDTINVSEPWSILPEDDDPSDDEGWRIGGRQPFAYNAANNMLVTLMHNGGGQETFEDGGTEVWAFSVDSKRRGYKIELGEETKGASVQLTKDADPLLLVAPSGHETLRIYTGKTGHLEQEMEEMSGALIQNL